jgi:hypothetical protein
VDLSFLPRSSSIARLAGLLFFAGYFYQNVKSGTGKLFPPLSGAMKWFLFYTGIIAMHNLFEPEENMAHVIQITSTLAQLLVFFWLSAEVMTEEKIAIGVLRETHAQGVQVGSR